jgi:hypothetical protein
LSLTVLAIDGVGAQTADYLGLLRMTGELVEAKELRLLSSDSEARAPGVRSDKIPRLDYLAYSRFCVESLHEFVDTDHCLCVQLDGFIVNPELWSPSFLDYDFIGAPWLNKKNRPIEPGRSVGNGGFSIRSQRYLREAGRLRWHRDWPGAALPERHLGNEDYFLNVLHRDEMVERGIRFASEDLAMRFSIQSGDQLNRGHRIRNAFGFHGTGLLGRARRQTLANGIDYPHLRNQRPSRFPWRY